MRFVALLESAYRDALEADPAYSGHYVKTPGHARWNTTVFRREAYDLWELSEWVRLPETIDMRRKPDLTAIAGRNCYLFERLRRWSYQAVRKYWRPGGFDAFLTAVEAYAERINTEIEAEFPGRGPLHFPEMRHTVKSVANWTWAHMTPANFRKWCAEKGRAGGVASGKSRRKGSLTEAAPWKAEGISRATWYRRRAKEQMRHEAISGSAP